MTAGWNGKRVVVTGAGGFIGSHLAERLVENGATVRALVRYDSAGSWGWLDASPVKGEIEIIAGDVRDRDCMVELIAGADVVFHLAALIAIPYSYRAPQSYVQTNIEGTLNALQAARQADVARFVHTSTSEVYGTARYVPIDEAHPLQGQSPYSASKIGADKMAEAFFLAFRVPVVTVRPFNTYGPRQSARAVIPTIITQALSPDHAEIRLGSLDPTRDFNFVTDTADGFLAAAASDDCVGETVNLGSGREISIGDLAAKIQEIIGTQKPIVCDSQRLRPDASEVERLLAATEKMHRLTPWRPQTPLEIGIPRTVDWLTQNLHRYRPDHYTV